MQGRPKPCYHLNSPLIHESDLSGYKHTTDDITVDPVAAYFPKIGVRSEALEM